MDEDVRETAPEPLLGLATTEELMRELIARFTVKPHTFRQFGLFDKALAIAEMLGSLDAQDKEYKTVDSY